MAGTTEDKLNYLIRSKEDVRLAIERMQIDCPENTPFLDYGPKIKQVDVDLSDATVTSSDLMEGVIAYNAKEERLVGTIPNLGQLVYEPSDELQEIPYGRTRGGHVKKTDITKLNEYQACLAIANSVDNLDDYSDTTATAMDIREGKIAYANGERITGIMPDSNTGLSANGLTTFTIPSALRFMLDVDIPDTCTNFSKAFQNCSSLLSIGDLSKVPLTNVTYMFDGCKSLTEIPNLNTTAAISGAYMFRNCQAITEVPDINTANMTDMSYMFYGCSNLEEAPNLNTSKVTNFNYMFQDCTSLIEAPKYNWSNASNCQSIFKGCTGMLSAEFTNTRSSSNPAGLFSGCTSLKTATFAAYATAYNSIFSDCTNLETVKITDAYGNAINNKSIQSVFKNCTNLKTIEGNIYCTVPDGSNSDTAYFTSLFDGCESIENLDNVICTRGSITNNNRSGRNSDYMFRNCKSLKNIPPSLEALENYFCSEMRNMFTNCESITKINNFVCSPYCTATFQGCKSLETANILLKTGSSGQTQYLFKDCTSLKNVTGNITSGNGYLDAQYWFYGCTSLEQTPDIFETAEITGMYAGYAFRNCTSLKTVREGFVSKMANSLPYCFAGCTSLKNVPEFDGSRINSAQVEYWQYMFQDCPNLTTESLNNIMASMTKYKGTHNTRSLARLGFSSAQAALCQTLSNWAGMSAAGWTVGY
jgi:surface protein